MINNSRKTPPYNLKIGYFAQVRPVTDSVEVGNPEIILATSGESFFWARRFLGKKMGHDAARLYSFCRVLDDMADGDIENGPEHLVNIQNSLNRGDWENNRFLQQFSGLVSEYNFSPDVISSLIEGLMDDQAPEVLIEDEEQLIQYAYKVAGTVGLLMCGVLNTDEHRAKAHAVDLGIGMQLTNIARDVVVDAKMGRRYLPGEWVNNMSPEEILVAAENPTSDNGLVITAAVKRLLALAEEYYASGRVGLSYLPARAHFSIGVAAKVYRQIGIQLLRSKTSWHGPKQVTSKASKVVCTLKATLNLYRRFPHPRKPHNSNLHSWLKPNMRKGVS